MSTSASLDHPMQSRGGTQSAQAGGQRRRRCKGSSRRAAVFQRDRHVTRITQQWDNEQGGTPEAMTRFNNYSSRRALTTNNTTRLHHDELTSSISDWTSRTHAMSQHYSLRQDERTFESLRKSKSNVPQIGGLPPNRPDGVFRIMYCQLNGLAEFSRRTEKISNIMGLAQQYEVDGAALCEVGVNWSYQARNHRLSNWLNDKSDREIKATTSHNIHGPKRTVGQYGGTALVLFNSLLQYGQGTAQDHRNLGRWSSWILSSTPLHRTRMVVAYCPGRSKRTGTKTVYQQHLRLIQTLQLACTPYQLFLDDLTKQIKCWQAAGDRILLFIDANEHILSGRISKKLAELGIQERSHKFWGSTEPNTYIDGSQPIDGIFASPELEITNCLSLSFHESVGDHHTIIVELSTRSILGQHQSTIVRPTSRRLTTKHAQSVTAYNECFRSQVSIHRIAERTESLKKKVQEESYPSGEETSTEILCLLKQMDEIKACSERGCRKILKPAAPCSPPIAFWNDKIHAYQHLLRLKQGAHPGMSRSHTYRMATGKNIEHPAQLTIKECSEGVRLAKIRIKDLRIHADGLRRQHLGSTLQTAIDNGDEETQRNIRNRMRREYNTIQHKKLE